MIAKTLSCSQGTHNLKDGVSCPKIDDMELYEPAVEILAEKLTPSGLIGFFLQCNPVTGDCSVNRHTWLDKLEKGTVLQDIHTSRKKRND